MKQEILTRKNIVLVLTALSFIYVIHGVADAEELRFIDGETTIREIAENAAVGTNVGASLQFSNNTCRRFRLLGPDAGSFKLARVYRGVQLKTMSTFDYEAKNSYEVSINASSTWSSDTITVTINVTNVNEAPMFTGANSIHRSIPESTASGTNIGNPVSATDPDGNSTLTYNLGGVNAGMFGIDSSTG